MAITCKTGDRIEERVPRCPSGRAVEDLIVGRLSYTFPRFGGGIAMCGLLRCSETGSTAEEAALNRRGSVRVLGQAFGTFEHRGRIARRTENKSGVTFVCSGSKSGSGPRWLRPTASECPSGS